MKPAALLAWGWVHRWSALICSIFLLLAFVSGLFLIWTDELDAAFAGHPYPPSHPAQATLSDLDRVFARALERAPGERITHADWAFDGRLLGVNLTDDSGERSRQLVFDAASGAFLEDLKTDNPRQPMRILLGFMNSLHITLFAGLTGELLLALMAVLGLVATISGVVLYGPYRRGMEFGELRAGRRRSWLDVHNLLGIVTVGWVLVVLVTGFMNALTVPAYAHWQAQTMQSLDGERSAAVSPPGPGIGPSAAVAAASRAAPDSRMVRIVPPGGWRGLPDNYVVWLQGITPAKQKIFRPVLVDAATARVTRDVQPPWYLQVLQMSRPLHFGDYAGTPLKILWTLLDVAAIAIFISGLKLWRR